MTETREGGPSHLRHLRVALGSVGTAGLRSRTPTGSPSVSRSCGDDEFVRQVTKRLADGRRLDVLALIELQDPDPRQALKGDADQAAMSVSPLDPILTADLSAMLLEDDCFCWRDGRIHVLLSPRTGGDGLRRLRRMGRRLSLREEGSASDALHPTPAIGYLRLRSGRTAGDLFSQG